MYKIGLLNSYLYHDDRPLESIRIQSFLAGLAARGLTPGVDVVIQMVHTNSQEEIKDQINIWLEDGVDVIHAIGTPNAALARQATNTIPIVYYGAHPQGVGREECSGWNVCGLELLLPLSFSYKKFRILRKLVPYAKKIYVPFYENVIFCYPEMRRRYREWQKIHGPSWIPQDSGHIGYRGLAGLAEIIGLDYFEFFLTDNMDIEKMLDSLDLQSGLLMVYNDLFYCKDAPERLLRGAWERRIPVIWNNNADMASHGALAGIAGCFEEAADVSADMCIRILQGQSPGQIGLVQAHKGFAAYNMEAAERFNLEPDANLLASFQQVVNGSPI